MESHDVRIDELVGRLQKAAEEKAVVERQLDKGQITYTQYEALLKMITQKYQLPVPIPSRKNKG